MSLSQKVSVVSFVFILAVLTGNYVVAKEKIVMCYYGTWATYRGSLGKFDVEHINTNLCTHLVYTFVGLNNQGSVVSLDPYLDLPDNWGRDNFRKFNALKQNNAKLKTILAVGGWNEGSAKFSRMAANRTLKSNFISSAVKMVRDYGFDGLDVDWEYPNRRDTVNAQADIENYTQLLRELREEFDEYGLLLTAAVASVKEMASLSYDIPAISNYLDIISIMAYDMYGAWDTVTGHNSPLHKGEGDEEADREKMYTVDVALEYWIKQGCPPEKIILGLPLYGRTFTLADPNVNSVRAPASGAGIAGPYTATNGVIGYNEFCSILHTQSWDVRKDSSAKVPYAVQGRNWVSYDNAESLVKKIEYGLSFNISGVMVWSIETDDFHGICHGVDFPLLRAINNALNKNLSDIPSSTTIGTSDVPSLTTITPSTIPLETTSSESATSIPNDICKEEGLTANPSDCSSFYMCIKDVDGNLIPAKFQCPNDLYWDDKNKYCNYPDLVECEV